MSISIITPAYNGAKYLRETVESVLAQTYTDWEQIIVDDGSSDGTFELAQELSLTDPRIRAYRKDNGGVATARNFGYEQISPNSEFLIYLDQDDIWRPDTLQKLLDLLQSDLRLVAAHALTRQTDLSGNPVGAPGGTIMSEVRRKVVGTHIEFCERTEPTTFNTLICDCCIPTPGVALIRRSAFERIKTADGLYFDQSVASGDDWDVWLRLSLLGDFGFLDEVLIDWRQHESNGSKNEYVTCAAESKVRKKMATWPELTSEQRAMADWRYRRIYASIERRNAKICWSWLLQTLREGKWDRSAKLALTWQRRYLQYLGLKLFWNARKQQLPIPSRLIELSQVLEL